MVLKGNHIFRIILDFVEKLMFIYFKKVGRMDTGVQKVMKKVVAEGFELAIWGFSKGGDTPHTC